MKHRVNDIIYVVIIVFTIAFFCYYLNKVKENYSNTKIELIKANLDAQKRLRAEKDKVIDSLKKVTETQKKDVQIIYKYIHDKNSTILRANNSQLDSMLRAEGL